MHDLADHRRQVTRADAEKGAESSAFLALADIGIVDDSFP